MRVSILAISALMLVSVQASAQTLPGQCLNKYTCGTWWDINTNWVNCGYEGTTGCGPAIPVEYGGTGIAQECALDNATAGYCCNGQTQAQTCAKANCGLVNDGCGVMYNCGTCSGGAVCWADNVCHSPAEGARLVGPDGGIVTTPAMPEPMVAGLGILFAVGGIFAARKRIRA